MKFLDAYFAVSDEQVDGFWQGICDGINLNSAIIHTFTDTSGRCGFPPSKYFPASAEKMPDIPNEAPPFNDNIGIFNKIPDGSEANTTGTDWTQQVSDDFNRVHIVHARIRESLVNLCKTIPEFIGTSREEVLSAFPQLDGTEEYTDPETGETFTKLILPYHEWR